MTGKQTTILREGLILPIINILENIQLVPSTVDLVTPTHGVLNDVSYIYFYFVLFRNSILQEEYENILNDLFENPLEPMEIQDFIIMVTIRKFCYICFFQLRNDVPPQEVVTIAEVVAETDAEVVADEIPDDCWCHFYHISILFWFYNSFYFTFIQISNINNII